MNAPGQPGEDASSLDRLGYEAWWGLPALPKLNTDYQPVRDYLLNVAEHWIRFGIDGWRLDVPEEIADPVVLAGVPGTGPGGQSRTPTSSARSGGSRRSGWPAIASTRS